VRPKIYFGWWIVAAGFSYQILHSSLLFLSQGAYLIELQTAFGWSKSSISGAFSLLRVESGLLGPVQGWMIDRFGPRPVMLIGTVLFGLGFILFGFIDSLWEFYLTFGLVAIGSSLGGFLTINTAIAHWFYRKRARAMSVTSVGFASGALIAPIVALSMVTFGWRDTAIVSGIVVFIIGVPASLMFRRSPEAFGLLPDGETEERRRQRTEVSRTATESGEGEPDFTVREAMRDRAFWYIAVGHGTALLVTSTIPVHLVPYLVEQNGWSPAAASLVFPAIMVMQIMGLVVGGTLGDLYSKRIVSAIAMFGHGGAFIVLAFSSSIPAVAAAVIMHGLAWGARGPLMMAIRADYFGRRNLGLIAGWSNAVTITGSVIGPVYAGIMFDRLGTYDFAFWTMGAVTIVSTVFFLAARKPPLPKRDAAPRGAA
jgi:sugar phosphate permease